MSIDKRIRNEGEQQFAWIARLVPTAIRRGFKSDNDRSFGITGRSFWSIRLKSPSVESELRTRLLVFWMHGAIRSGI